MKQSNQSIRTIFAAVPRTRVSKYEALFKGIPEVGDDKEAVNIRYRIGCLVGSLSRAIEKQNGEFTDKRAPHMIYFEEPCIKRENDAAEVCLTIKAGLTLYSKEVSDSISFVVRIDPDRSDKKYQGGLLEFSDRKRRSVLRKLRNESRKMGATVLDISDDRLDEAVGFLVRHVTNPNMPKIVDEEILGQLLELEEVGMDIGLVNSEQWSIRALLVRACHLVPRI